MSDFARLRRIMVDTQVRPSDVSKFPIIDAMLTVPRELFVPQNKRELAYVGEHVDLGEGRFALDPRTLAKMLEAANVQRGDLVLDIAPGLGYTSALLARMADGVIALEDTAERVESAEAALAEAEIDSVAVMEGHLNGGSEASAPYDLILINGAIEVLPDALVAQLKDKGRIAAIFMDGPLGSAKVGHYIDGKMNWRFAFNATAPLLPGFAKEQAFAL